MTPRAHSIVEIIRQALIAAESCEPAEADLIYAMLVNDLRSRRPECVSALTLGPPTELIRDPRRVP